MNERRAIGDLDLLLDRAITLVAAWGASATMTTTVGQERAILRLFGVGGLDRAGRPLANEVVDRYLAPDPRRLAGGIALPFAMAMAEYDLGPQELAIEAAAGTVDLALEAELLAEPDRRAVAEADARRLGEAARDRIDANRLARRELIHLLGDQPRPWIGTSLTEPAIVDALDEAGAATAAGVGLLRVEVPAGRELADLVRQAGGVVEPWRPTEASRSGLHAFDPAGTPVPTGSQRALGVLRRFVDEAAAERRGYVRLCTEAPALAAPEQAVVAAFERVDVVIADPIAEIVTGRIDPDRALADHAFAQRLLARAGAQVLIPSGPLVVGPDLASGVPSDPATRAGRALALQLIAALLARGSGIAAERVVIGAVPHWLVDEPGVAARAAAEIAVRRALLPGHPLAFVEPVAREESIAIWPALLGALLPDAGDVALILRRPGATFPVRARATRAAAAVAAELAGSREAPALAGPALDHARGSVAAAIVTIKTLEDVGWRGLVDDPRAMEGRIGAEAVAERTEPFDPLASR